MSPKGTLEKSRVSREILKISVFILTMTWMVLRYLHHQNKGLAMSKQFVCGVCGAESDECTRPHLYESFTTRNYFYPTTGCCSFGYHGPDKAKAEDHVSEAQELYDRYPDRVGLSELF